jgi:hypothetical protein
MTGDTQPPKFDAGSWVKMARFAAAASVVLLAGMVAILQMFDPPNQCPGWHLKDMHSTSLWTFLAMWTTPLVVINCFIAVRWNWVARRAALRLTDEKVPTLFFGPITPPAIPVTYFMVRMCIWMSLLSQLPLIFVVEECTDWLRA